MVDTFNKIHSLIMKQYTNTLQLYGLTYMQWIMLRELYLNEDNELNAKTLEVLTNQNKRLVSINLQKLEDLNYISRYTVEGDKRGKVIELEESAVAVCDDLLLIDNEIIELYFGKLTSEELDTLKILLDKIN